MMEDSIFGIFEIFDCCVCILQLVGGIGLSIYNIWVKGSYIKGMGGISNGIVLMLKVFNDIVCYVDQGGGKCKGVFVIYLEFWYVDVFDFLELKKNYGKEELCVCDLFYVMWILDLFMCCVKENGDWLLFDLNEVLNLFDVYSGEFEVFYYKYE